MVARVPALRASATLIRRVLATLLLFGCGAAPEPPTHRPYGDLERPALRVTGSIAQWEALLRAVDARFAPRDDALAGIADAWMRVRARASDELDPEVWGVDPAVPLRLSLAGTPLGPSRAALAAGVAEPRAGWRLRLAFGVRDASRLASAERTATRGVHGRVEWGAQGVDPAPDGDGEVAAAAPAIVVDFAALAVLEAALGARDPSRLDVTTACVETWTRVAELVPVARIVLGGGATFEAEIQLALTSMGRRRWRTIGPVRLSDGAALWSAAESLARCGAGNHALALLAVAAMLPEYASSAAAGRAEFLDLRVDPAVLARNVAGTAVGGLAAPLDAMAGRFGRATLRGEVGGQTVTYVLRVGPPPGLESPGTAQ